MSPHISLSRRRFLRATSALAASGVVGPVVSPAFAKAPMTNTQVPSFYRFRIGSFEATMVSDGPLPVGPASGVFATAPKEDLGRTFADNFLSADNVVLEQNVLVVNTGEHLVLFDTGMGTAKLFGNDTGRLLASLKAAGVEPKDIDAVVLSHAHPDHCWGLMTDDGSRVFPNARIYMAEADFGFWTDEAKLANEQLKAFIAGTRNQLLPNRERMTFVKDGQEFLPGIHAMAAPGHTVGHTIFTIASQGRSLCYAADIAHHYVVSFGQPRLEFAFDADPKQGVATRLRVLDMLATDRIELLGYHLPWPGIGHVAKRGDAFAFVPSPMRMVL